ncbi:hypothetical protein ES705_51044 [subsurface metagenome]
MSVYINSTSFGLFQEFFHILQVMAADENCRITSDSNIYFGYLRIPITGSIGFIQ